MPGLTRRQFLQSMGLGGAEIARRLYQVDKTWQTFLPFVGNGGEIDMPIKMTFIEPGSLGAVNHVLWDSNPHVRPRCGPCDITVIRTKGFGMPGRMRDITEPVGPTQDGITLVESHWQTRTVNLAIKLNGTYDELISGRRELARWFTPYRYPDPFGSLFGVLRVETNVIRDLDCRYMSGLEFDDEVADVDEMLFDVRLWAENPLWYDGITTDNIRSYTHNPGAFTYNYTPSNDGDWNGRLLFIYLDSQSTGTIIDPVIENLTTGHKLDLTGYTLASGTVITYILQYNSLDVQITGGTSILSDLSSDSDLGEFILQPGDNVFRTTVDNASTATTLRTRVQWNDNFLTA
jgi:hypothetical protein